MQRGQPLTAENQRENARTACAALAPVALEHELVIAHGNGPQVGLLALQGSAYTAVEPYPLDLLGAQTEGMIGYLIQQELGNQLPRERPLATLLTLIEVDAADPAFGNPTKPIGPIYDQAESERLAAEKGWTFKPDGDSFRRVVPSPAPRRIFEIHAIRSLLEQGTVVICAGGGGIPTTCRRARSRRAAGIEGVEAVIDKDLASALLADRSRRRYARDRHRRRRRLSPVGARSEQRPIRRGTPRRALAEPAVSRRARWARRCSRPASSSSRPARVP